MSVEDACGIFLPLEDKGIKKIALLVENPEIMVVNIRVDKQKLLERLLAVVISSVPKQIGGKIPDDIFHV